MKKRLYKLGLMRSNKLPHRSAVSGITISLMMVIGLAGCSSSDYSDLRAYVQKVKSRPAGRISPVPEFKTYETFEYTASNLRDPFTMFGNEAELVEEAVSNNGIQPDLNRNKETLEQYPLDTLKFVGHLEKGGEKWAIVTSPDNLVHRVTAGNHLGTNYGEIIDITETKILITEVIRDGMGGWIEREAALSMSE